MLISIIIPVYKVEDYIVKCLESVVAQTYTGAMECLIIDDCGQDDSILLAEKFLHEYNGSIEFRIIHHEKNRGLSAARNTGIRESKGEWLYFLDSDDWITENCMESMMEQVKKHPDVDMVQGGALSNNEGFATEYSIENKDDVPCYSENRDWINAHVLLQKRIVVTVWNKLINKKFLTHFGLFFEEGKLNEDEFWSFMLSKHLTKIAFTHKDTYYYNIRHNSIVGNREKIVANYPNILKFRIKHIGGKFRSREVAMTAKFILIFQMYNKTKETRNIYRWMKIVLLLKACLWQKIPLFNYIFLHKGEDYFHRLWR